MRLRGSSTAVILNGFPESLTAVLIKVEKAEQVAQSRIWTKIHAVFFFSQKISGMQLICIHLRKHLYFKVTCWHLSKHVKNRNYYGNMLIFTF